MPRGRKPKKGGNSSAEAGGVAEDVWAQCDTCQKWRKLPPGTVIDDSNPWFCNANPDVNRNSCEAPEENWQQAEGVEQADVDEREAKQQHSDTARRRRKDEFDDSYGDRHYKRAKKPAGASDSKQFASPQAEIREVALACQRLVDNSGAWNLPANSSGPLSPSQIAPPDWVLHGISIVSSDHAGVVRQALELHSSSYAFKDMPPHGAERASQAELFARVACLTASSLLLQKLQDGFTPALSATAVPPPQPKPTVVKEFVHVQPHTTPAASQAHPLPSTATNAAGGFRSTVAPPVSSLFKQNPAPNTAFKPEHTLPTYLSQIQYHVPPTAHQQLLHHAQQATHRPGAGYPPPAGHTAQQPATLPSSAPASLTPRVFHEDVLNAARAQQQQQQQQQQQHMQQHIQLLQHLQRQQQQQQQQQQASVHNSTARISHLSPLVSTAPPTTAPQRSPLHSGPLDALGSGTGLLSSHASSYASDSAHLQRRIETSTGPSGYGGSHSRTEIQHQYPSPTTQNGLLGSHAALFDSNAAAALQWQQILQGRGQQVGVSPSDQSGHAALLQAHPSNYPSSHDPSSHTSSHHPPSDMSLAAQAALVGSLLGYSSSKPGEAVGQEFDSSLHLGHKDTG